MSYLRGITEADRVKELGRLYHSMLDGAEVVSVEEYATNKYEVKVRFLVSGGTYENGEPIVYYNILSYYLQPRRW